MVKQGPYEVKTFDMRCGDGDISFVFVDDRVGVAMMTGPAAVKVMKQILRTVSASAYEAAGIESDI